MASFVVPVVEEEEDEEVDDPLSRRATVQSLAAPW
jgi:hypothetical protein